MKGERERERGKEKNHTHTEKKWNAFFLCGQDTGKKGIKIRANRSGG